MLQVQESLNIVYPPVGRSSIISRITQLEFNIPVNVCVFDGWIPFYCKTDMETSSIPRNSHVEASG